MGIVKFTDQSNACNKVRIRFAGVTEDKNWYGIQPDIQIFPLYCNCCHKQQSEPYLHTGSRYGYVGTVQCEFCKSNIVVTDHDNIVNSIILDGKEISFHELFLLQWKYIKLIEIRYGVSIRNLLMKLDEEYIKIDCLRTLIENKIGIYTVGDMKFITDDRFPHLPEDINRWIELLYKANIQLGLEPVKEK
jgi:hypothetical protein